MIYTVHYQQAHERIALSFESFTYEKIKIYYLALRELRRFVSKTTPRGPNTKRNRLTPPLTNRFRYYWVLRSKLLQKGMVQRLTKKRKALGCARFEEN